MADAAIVPSFLFIEVRRMKDGIDLTGQRFDRWTALLIHSVKDSKRFYWCECDCGATKAVRAESLTKGTSRSCGCVSREYAATGNARRTHGRRRTPEYKTWSKVKSRCSNPRDQDYPDYGGRGIKVCNRWLTSFENFYADMGDRPSPDHSIDRIDNNLGYSPENCRWSNDEEQANNKRNNRKITIGCLTLSVSQWARELGVSRESIQSRLSRGWDEVDAICIPFGRVGCNRRDRA